MKGNDPVFSVKLAYLSIFVNWRVRVGDTLPCLPGPREISLWDVLYQHWQCMIRTLAPRFQTYWLYRIVGTMTCDSRTFKFIQWSLCLSSQCGTSGRGPSLLHITTRYLLRKKDLLFLIIIHGCRSLLAFILLTFDLFSCVRLIMAKIPDAFGGKGFVYWHHLTHLLQISR